MKIQTFFTCHAREVCSAFALWSLPCTLTYAIITARVPDTVSVHNAAMRSYNGVQYGAQVTTTGGKIQWLVFH